MKKFIFYTFNILVFTVIGCNQKPVNSLSGKIICIDPGHGGSAETDTFRVGPSGEREEWINLRVAQRLAQLLEEDGATVLLTRASDTTVDLKARAELAVNNKADVFVSIHHNAAADSSINFPIIYFHGNVSENVASVELGKLIASKLRDKLFDNDTPVSIVSDHVIFPTSGTAVLRHSYGIPGVICEASFFTNPAEEQRLKDKEYNRREAEAYYLSLKQYFANSVLEIVPKYSKIKLPPFPVFQEAERMNATAKWWREDFNKGKKLASFENKDSLQKALFLISQSIKSLPDSWLAREGHFLRSSILNKIGETADADTAQLRAHEFYAAAN